MNRSLMVVVGCSLALVMMPATCAAETLFEATLDALQNVPPTASTATGTAVLILNDAETEVSYVVTYDGLDGAEQGSHFHMAPPGSNGSILHPLPVGTPKFGVWPVGTHDLADLLAGNVYINIHTNLYPGGEIRGNLGQSTTDVILELEQEATWGQIKALYR